MSAVATCASCCKRLAWVTRNDRFLQFTLDGAGEKFVTARSKGGPSPGMPRKDPLWHRNRLRP
jgi:hypothetical protein